MEMGPGACMAWGAFLMLFVGHQHPCSSVHPSDFGSLCLNGSDTKGMEAHGRTDFYPLVMTHIAIGHSQRNSIFYFLMVVFHSDIEVPAGSHEVKE